jgi:hypothetical protein
MISSQFLLSKWYLDCVAENGAAFIGYAAVLQWKALSLHYASILLHDPVTGAHTRTSLHANTLPEQRRDSIHWAPPSLEMDGRWTPLIQPIERHLYADETGDVVWRCVQPKSSVHIDLGTGREITGVGYVEQLSLSILPWRLPIQELRWGRYTGTGESLVWIDWRGKMPQSLLFHNGGLLPGAHIADDEIAADNYRLALAPFRTLREGSLLSTTLDAIPGISLLVPDALLQTYECKWLSRGTFSLDNKPIDSGWAIHEVVRFA